MDENTPLISEFEPNELDINRKFSSTSSQNGSLEDNLQPEGFNKIRNSVEKVPNNKEEGKIEIYIKLYIDSQSFHLSTGKQGLICK